jgi:hypothetical protein
MDRSFTAMMHHNWGYWDGLALAGRGQMPEWAKRAGQAHPFDADYGEGFWKGWRGEPDTVLRR